MPVIYERMITAGADWSTAAVCDAVFDTLAGCKNTFQYNPDAALSQRHKQFTIFVDKFVRNPHFA